MPSLLEFLSSYERGPFLKKSKSTGNADLQNRECNFCNRNHFKCWMHIFECHIGFTLYPALHLKAQQWLFQQQASNTVLGRAIALSPSHRHNWFNYASSCTIQSLSSFFSSKDLARHIISNLQSVHVVEMQAWTLGTGQESGPVKMPLESSSPPQMTMHFLHRDHNNHTFIGRFLPPNQPSPAVCLGPSGCLKRAAAFSEIMRRCVSFAFLVFRYLPQKN